MPCAPPLSSVHVPHLHHAPTCGLFVPTPYSYKATTRSPPPPPTTMAIQVSSPFQNDLRAGKETPFLQNKNALTRALHGLPTSTYIPTHLPLHIHKHLNIHSGLPTPIFTPTQSPTEENCPSQARTPCGQEGSCEKSPCCQEGGCQGGWQESHEAGWQAWTSRQGRGRPRCGSGSRGKSPSYPPYLPLLPALPRSCVDACVLEVHSCS